MKIKNHLNNYALTFIIMLAPAAVMAGTASGGKAPAVTPPANETTERNPHPCMCLGAHQGGDSSERFSGSVSLGYDSTFFCRGMDMGDDMFSAGLNIDVALTDTLTFTASTRYLTVDETNFDELHTYAGLFARVGIVSFGPSFRWYHNFEGGMVENAYDLGFQALANVGPVDFHAGYFYETESEGHFVELGVSSTFKVHEKFSLRPAVEIGYTDGWMMPIQGWNQVTLRLDAPIQLIDSLVLTPWIGANVPLEALDGQDNKLVGGVSLALKF
jgi:hypothetical protein